MAIMAMIMNVIMPWNFNHNDDEPEQLWNWQWHCLNISICQWRIENILLKSVPQRVICSCTAWSVGFTCIKNSTLISKQIFSWFSFWLWCHRTARWLQVLCTTGLLLFAGKHLALEIRKKVQTVYYLSFEIRQNVSNGLQFRILNQTKFSTSLRFMVWIQMKRSQKV